DHFLALDPIDLTVDLLEQHLLAAETSVVAVGAPRGTPRTPFFEGCSPSPLPPSYAFAAAVDILGAEDVWEASSISGKRRSSKGKGGKSGGGGSRGGSGGGSGGGGGSGCGGSDGSGGGSGGSGGDGGGSGEGVAVVAAVGVVAVGLKLFRGEVLVVARGSSSSVGARTLLPCSFYHPHSSLPTPVSVRLANPLGRAVLAHSSTVLPCPAVPSSSLSGLHLASFSTNLVSALGPVVAHCLGRLLLHKTLLWHHRLGHPSLPRLRGMHSRLLVSGLPRSLPPLPPSPTLPCLPCVEGRQRAAPHSSFPRTTAPLQNPHMDV
ncbi:unnamed protein product, partial [Closterium sp. NIES-53]